MSNIIAKSGLPRFEGNIYNIVDYVDYFGLDSTNESKFEACEICAGRLVHLVYHMDNLMGGGGVCILSFFLSYITAPFLFFT